MRVRRRLSVEAGDLDKAGREDNIAPMSSSSFIVRRSRSRPAARLTELARVRLTSAVRDGDVAYPAGSTGTIVHVYRGGEALEIEVTTPLHGVITVGAAAVEALPQ